MLYLIPKRPDDKTYSHFSIEKGYAPAIIFENEGTSLDVRLISTLERMKEEPAKNLYELEQIPEDSIGKIDKLLQEVLGKCSSKTA